MGKGCKIKSQVRFWCEVTNRLQKIQQLTQHKWHSGLFSRPKNGQKFNVCHNDFELAKLFIT